LELRIILINPWIYDFAAVNLWSRPLGLLKVAEYLSQFDFELFFIDCMDACETKIYGKGKYAKEIIEKPECIKSVPRRFGRYGMSIDDFRAALKKNSPFDLVFITSIMSYWYPGIQKAIEIMRTEFKNAPIILGGIYATLWHGHASETSGADFIYKGHIDDSLQFALKTFGFRLRKKNKATPYYKLGLYNNYPFAPVLTSYGCPYKCSYCGTNLLNKGFFKRETRNVVEEIKELYSKGVCDFAFYDDALFFNADSHIKVILKRVINNGMNIRFHCPNGLHARFIDNELAYLMKKSGFKTVRLSLETVDGKKQKQTGGKVTSEELNRAVMNLKRQGFTKSDTGVYLMYGLPGQELDEVREGIEFLKSLDVRINLTEYSPVPGTQCWSELINKGIISDDIDPLLTNNSVFSFLFSGYVWYEIKKLKDDVNQYNTQKPVS
jgi:radical SAM superfamily enzyme YgiQ (UPF0313 family)